MAAMIPGLDILITFAKIGLYSFGSATSEVILEQVVEEKAWLSKERFLESLSLAALVPGPFHVNLVGLIGYSLAGLAGGIAALTAFVLPGLMLALGIAVLLSQEPVGAFLHANPGIVAGMMAAIGGLLLNVIITLAKTALPKPIWGLAVVLLAVAIEYLHLNFAVAILAAGFLYTIFSSRRQTPRPNP